MVKCRSIDISKRTHSGSRSGAEALAFVKDQGSRKLGKTPGEDRGIWKGARNQERIEGNLEQDQIWSITAVRSRSSDTRKDLETPGKDRGIGEATRDLDKHLERILEKHWKGLKKREGAEIGKFNLS